MTATPSSTAQRSATSRVVQEGLERVEECGKSGWDGSEVAQQKPLKFWLLFRLPLLPSLPSKSFACQYRKEKERQKRCRERRAGKFGKGLIDLEDFRRNTL